MLQRTISKVACSILHVESEHTLPKFICMKTRRGSLQVLTDTYTSFKEGVNTSETATLFFLKLFYMHSLL